MSSFEGIRLALRPGQAIEVDGKTMKLKGRARDRARRLIFLDGEGIPRDFADHELLSLQAERRLRFLTETEFEQSSVLLERPRISSSFAVSKAQEDELTAEAMRKYAYIRAWEQAGCPSRTETAIRPIVERVALELDDNAAHSPRQVLRWLADFMTAGRNVEILVPQIMNSGNFFDRLDPVARDLLHDTVEENWLIDTQPTIVSVYEKVKIAFRAYNRSALPSERLKLPSIDAVYREARRIDAYTTEYCRKGKGAADHKHAPVGTAPEAKYANECWEIDHTRVNCIAIDLKTGLPIGRPWITVIIDRYSRLIIAVWLSFDPPSVEAVFQCLKSGILPKDGLLQAWGVTGDWPACGRCVVLIPDNGKEFKSKSFINACAKLGIDLQYTPILKAWYKGKVERVIQTLSRKVFEVVPGTTFASVFERNKERVPEKIAKATLADLWFHVLDWIVNSYNTRHHRGIDARPIDRWRSSVATGMQPPIDPAKLDRILAVVYYRVPQRYGVEFKGVYYNSADLTALRVRAKRDRFVRLLVDPADLGTISFIDPADGAPKLLYPQRHHRHSMKGRTLEMHVLARALQRENPDKFSGDDGVDRAHLLLVKTMKDRSGASGKENKRQAAKSWAAINRIARSEDPSAFNALSQASIADEVFTGDYTGVVTDVELTEDRSHQDEPASQKSKSNLQRRRKTTSPTKLKLVEEDGLDLDDYAIQHSLRIQEEGSD